MTSEIGDTIGQIWSWRTAVVIQKAGIMFKVLEKCRSSGGNGSSLYRVFLLPSWLKMFQTALRYSINCRPPSPIEASVCSKRVQFQGCWNAVSPEKRQERLN
jgi:hypothetical protein